MVRRAWEKLVELFRGRRFRELLQEHGSPDAELILKFLEEAERYGLDHPGDRHVRGKLPETLLTKAEREALRKIWDGYVAYVKAAQRARAEAEWYLTGVHAASDLTDRRLAEIAKMGDPWRAHEEAKKAAEAGRELRAILGEDARAKVREAEANLLRAKAAIEQGLRIVWNVHERVKRGELRR